MKKYSFIILLCAIFTLSAQSLNYDFSIGTIGGSGLFSETNTIFYLEGSLLDFYITNTQTNLGLYLSPLNYFATNNKTGLSLVNAELFHKTFKPTTSSFIGPYIGIQWINFENNLPVIKSGIKCSIRDAFTLGLYGSELNYYERVLFNYIDIELGYINRYQTNQIYFSIKTDATFLFALIPLVLYSEAETSTKKYVPDYKERLPK